MIHKCRGIGPDDLSSAFDLEAVDGLGFALEVTAFTHNRIFITAPARLFILDYIVLTGVVADIRTYHLLTVLNA